MVDDLLTDIMYGDDEKIGLDGQEEEEERTVGAQLFFGTDLMELARREGRPVPALIEAAITYIENYGAASGCPVLRFVRIVVVLISDPSARLEYRWSFPHRRYLTDQSARPLC